MARITKIIMPFYASLFFYGTILHHSVAALTCENNGTCGRKKYCAAGNCLKMSRCREDVDCINPSNVFVEQKTTCVSSRSYCKKRRCNKVCRKSQKCARCSADSMCEGNKCGGSINCINDDCKCEHTHFNSNGREVCGKAKTPTTGPNNERGNSNRTHWLIGAKRISIHPKNSTVGQYLC